jgi:predicted GH43/DUF377 family glycosyl hydrolase
LATPVSVWERLKIGGGTSPILTRHGWLILYHDVSKIAEAGNGGRRLRIGVVRIDFPEILPSGGVADPREAKV